MIEFPQDVRKLRAIIGDSASAISDIDAQTFWRWRSWMWSAGWMIVPDGDDADVAKWYEKFRALNCPTCPECGAEMAPAPAKCTEHSIC